MYLRSCALGDIDKLNILALNFGDWLDNISMSEYTPSLPKWLESKKRENGSEPAPTKRTRNTHNSNNQPRHQLQSWDKGTRLQRHENYYRIFQSNNRSGIDHPVTKQNKQMCILYFGTDSCYGNCNHSHANLDPDEKET